MKTYGVVAIIIDGSLTKQAKACDCAKYVNQFPHATLLKFFSIHFIVLGSSCIHSGDIEAMRNSWLY